MILAGAHEIHEKKPDSRPAFLLIKRIPARLGSRAGSELQPEQFRGVSPLDLGPDIGRQLETREHLELGHILTVFEVIGAEQEPVRSPDQEPAAKRAIAHQRTGTRSRRKIAPEVGIGLEQTIQAPPGSTGPRG